MELNKVMIASPVNKNVRILKEFLHSLKRLNTNGCKVSYCFADDNDDNDASLILAEFVSKTPNAFFIKTEGLYKNTVAEKADHLWSRKKIEKLITVKNQMINLFLDGEYSHLFFIDADLVLHANTLITLLEGDKDIIANIFWTKWQENSIPLPQVWLKDFYTLYNDDMLINRTVEQTQSETMKFLNQLKIPGIYKVGGLGACTLIKRIVLEAGVNFNPIYNLSFWGEDRSFCIRSAVMGFSMYVNTKHPAHHIYRMEDLNNIPKELA